MSTIVDSRWNIQRDRSENDKPIKTDWVYLELLAPGLRRPWSYQYLTTPYLAALAKRSTTNTFSRIKHLKKNPHYIERADLPKNNNQSLIYNITTAGIHALEELHDTKLPRVKLRSVHHELMSCMIAASFELSGFEIRPDIQIDLGSIRPDWAPFAVKNDHHYLLCLIEADTGRNSEPIESTDPERSSIAHKFHEYLPLIHKGQLQDTMICFVTTGNIRVQSMLKCLDRIIAEGKYPRHYAKQFAFRAIKYSKHFDELPAPSAWAGTEDWLRAGYPPFNFGRGD